MIQTGMQYGVPFPEIYDWTWGEVSDYIRAKREARRLELREQAQMNFRTAVLLRKLFGGEVKQGINVVEAFDFLWSPEEIYQMQEQALKEQMKALKRKKEVGDDG